MGYMYAVFRTNMLIAVFTTKTAADLYTQVWDKHFPQDSRKWEVKKVYVPFLENLGDKL